MFKVTVNRKIWSLINPWCACARVTVLAVEFSILLHELFQAGISRKCWRLVRNWYSNLVSQVKLGTHLSKPINISRGIRQGSVLSPTIFNLVIDPLLSTLKQRNVGVSINGLHLGAFANADMTSAPAPQTLRMSANRCPLWIPSLHREV